MVQTDRLAFMTGILILVVLSISTETVKTLKGEDYLLGVGTEWYPVFLPSNMAKVQGAA